MWGGRQLRPGDTQVTGLHGVRGTHTRVRLTHPSTGTAAAWKVHPIWLLLVQGGGGAAAVGNLPPGGTFPRACHCKHGGGGGGHVQVWRVRGGRGGRQQGVEQDVVMRQVTQPLVQQGHTNRGRVRDRVRGRCRGRTQCVPCRVVMGVCLVVVVQGRGRQVLLQQKGVLDAALTVHLPQHRGGTGAGHTLPVQWLG